MNIYIPVRRLSGEQFWIKYYTFLQQRGYQLRPRYDPNWVPSWLDPNRTQNQMEDMYPSMYCAVVLDARRISDNKKVILKKVKTRTNEITVLQHISQPHLLADPRNHSTTLFDVIPLPDDDDLALVVIPFLMKINHLPFRHVGEIAEALEQLFETVAFLHEHDVIHGDVCYFNYLVDPSKMLPNGYHFGAGYMEEDGNTRFQWKERWATRPHKYYLADYGLSRRVINEKDKWIGGIWGQDRTVPEMTGLDMCDGFKVDIYQMGGIVRRLTEAYTGLEVFRPLAKKLMAKDPNMRPSAASAVHLLRYQLKHMSERQLSSWIWMTGDRELPWKKKIELQRLPDTHTVTRLASAITHFDQ